ncbi:hypothetical protein A5664_11720 [Mycolicibacterium fortuitum]|nr:hypothetical protein A5664_11720 [Mycolicibacterium fortuitum]
MSRGRSVPGAQGPRTFPLRTDPLPGESLYSWLQACAVRLDVSVVDLYDHMGLRGGGEMRRRLNAEAVSREDIAVISAAMNYPVADIEALTLARYAAMTAEIFGPPARLTTLARWHRVAGSQFCPQCLTASAGRWKLQWRLIWTFACTQHRCLLVDRCPTCDGRQHLRPLTGAVPPHPGQCDCPVPGNGQRPVRCDADLGQSPVVELNSDHPALTAQATMSALLDRGVVTWGAYRRHSRPTVDVVTDIRLLGRNILSAVSERYLDRFVPVDLVTEYRRALGPSGVHTDDTASSAHQWSTGPPIIRAVAITAALQILQSPDLRGPSPRRWPRSRARSPATT